jgi:hypothetical protein
MTTDDFLSAASDLNLLSLRDLVAARDQFHLHLINKPHVVATAVERYRIRIDGPWSTRQNPIGEPAKTQNAHPKRTLSNSEIRPEGQNPQFLPSKTLDEIGSILKGGPAPPPTATKSKRRAQPRRSTKR